MNKKIEVKGLLYEKGGEKPFYLCIYDPERATNEDDFYCRIHCPSLFKRDKNIFGIDKKQALELATDFIHNCLNGKKIVDDNGIEIDIKNY